MCLYSEKGDSYPGGIVPAGIWGSSLARVLLLRRTACNTDTSEEPEGRAATINSQPAGTHIFIRPIYILDVGAETSIRCNLNVTHRGTELHVFRQARRSDGSPRLRRMGTLVSVEAAIVRIVTNAIEVRPYSAPCPRPGHADIIRCSNQGRL
jgi:hypothetical protein